jgi:hypothetical protein
MCPQTICQGGSFALESVAAFVWNGWQACSGISGRLGVEYAPWLVVFSEDAPDYVLVDV